MFWSPLRVSLVLSDWYIWVRPAGDGSLRVHGIEMDLSLLPGYKKGDERLQQLIAYQNS